MFVFMLLVLLCFSCSVDQKSYPVYDSGEHQTSERPSVSPAWQGRYMPLVFERVNFEQGEHSISDILQDHSSGQLSFPYRLKVRIISLGRYHDTFSDWRMILEDASASISMYISGGSSLYIEHTGWNVELELWAIEEKYGQIQGTQISNINLVDNGEAPYFCQNWDPATHKNGAMVFWSSYITAIEAGTVYTLHCGDHPELRMTSYQFSETYLETGDYITVVAPVSYYYDSPQVDFVNFMPGSIWDYIYVH